MLLAQEVLRSGTLPTWERASSYSRWTPARGGGRNLPQATELGLLGNSLEMSFSVSFDKFSHDLRKLGNLVSLG